MIPFADLRHGDCREIIATLDDNSIDAIVTDPPYELGFMGKKWDNTGIAYDVQLWTQCLRVLKPGGHLLAFGGTRTYHRMASAIEDAGFEIRDSIHWLYGSGFPKSHDVSKGIDKLDAVAAQQLRRYQFTAWVRSTGVTAKQIDMATNTNMGGHYLTDASQPAVMTTDHLNLCRHLFGDVPEWVEREAEKRSVESLNFASREVVGTATSTTLEVAPGEGRERPQVVLDITAPATDAAREWEGWGTALKPAHEPIVVARKPLIGTVAANVLQHGTGSLNIDGARVGKRWPANVITDGSIDTEWVRYFYCAKPSRAERNAGLDALPTERRTTDYGAMKTRECNVCGSRSNRNGRWPDCSHDDWSWQEQREIGHKGGNAANTHPTVKPLALMRYLVRLVTPPGGTVLEPFAGSGTTMAAAILEGFDVIGCELTADYLPIIEGRIAWAQQQYIEAHDNLFGESA